MNNKLLFTLLISMPLFQCSSPTEEPKNDKISTDTLAVDTTNASTVLTSHNLTFEVDPEVGGRIVSFKVDGSELLVGKNVNADNYGSTFWTSPQSAWGWPPSKQIDKAPYAVKNEGGSLVLTSSLDSIQNVVITKTFKPDLSDTSIVITYSISNQSGKTQKIAPWEITRVAPKGLTLYPAGSGKKEGLLVPLTEVKNGVTYFNHVPEKVPQGVPKLLADGAEGWLAQVSGDLLFIKSFSDVPAGKAAPGEGEIEIYANPDGSYIEIEQQGEYKDLPNGETMIWEVKWYLKKLSEDLKNDPEKIIELVRTTVL